MSRAIRRAGAAMLSILAPAVAAAQGLTIEHEPARCVVAGRPATLRACFVPVGELAAARVHFRPEAQASWSQVEMRADAGCYAGVLPALGRDLVGTKVLYSIEAVDRTSAAHRSAEFAPMVVARAAECGGRGALAPVSGRGATKAVVIGGVALAGVAGAVLASGGDAPALQPTIAPAPPTTAPPTTEPPVAPPTPPPGGGLALSCQANPRSGTAPLQVSFAAFPAGATGSYAFEWSFGDGGTSNNPSPSYTYAAAGRFDAVVRVTSGGEAATCSREITATAPSGPGPAPTPTPGPTPTPTPTPSPTPTPGFTLTVHTDGNFIGQTHSIPPGLTCGFPPRSTCIATFAPNTAVTLTSVPDPVGHNEFTGDCTGINSCSLVMNSNKVVNVYFFRSSAQPRESRPFAGSSQLDVPDATGQVRANDGAAVAVRPGLAPLTAPTRIGTNRVEAVLARAAGRPGTWRFDFAGIKPGSLRVVTGTVALITGDAVVFRLEGKPGEKVVFIFEVEP